MDVVVLLSHARCKRESEEGGLMGCFGEESCSGNELEVMM